MRISESWIDPVLRPAVWPALWRDATLVAMRLGTPAAMRAAAAVLLRHRRRRG